MAAAFVPHDYTIADLEEAARETLPPETYEFFETGARDELTAGANGCAWQSYWLVPRVLVDVSSVHTATEVLGQAIDFPVLAAPMSMLGLAHPEGDRGLVRATASAGTIAILSQTSLTSLDDIAHVLGARFWAQHYPLIDRGVDAEVVLSAIDAGARAIVVTVDFPLHGVTRARPRQGFVFPANDQFPVRAARGQPILTSLTMDYIDWLRQIVGARMPIVVKGVLHPEDAVHLADRGVNAVVVSNHGGRALDGALPTAEALGPVVEAVQDRLEVYVDGGIRHGVDVLRALSLGARAVLVGRPLAWGLAYAGEAGVTHVLGRLRRELEEDSALAGVIDLRSIPAGHAQAKEIDVDDRLGQAAFLTNPLPILHELQDQEPLYWSSAWGVWVLTRFDDVISVLEDPTTYSSESRFTTLLDRLPAGIQPRIARLRRHYSYGLIQSDPPTHTRLRLMVRDAFTPRVMSAFRPTVDSLADALIDQFADRGSADLMEEFAYVLPISVMCELMGVPVQDRQLFIDWDTAISGIQATGAAQAERALAANDAIIAIEDYFLALARQRREQPGADLLSLMLIGHHGIQPLGDEELMAMCVGLLLGGHETTRSLIGNLMLSVLQRPPLLKEIQRRPDTIPSVVEEVLRFESPIQRGWRRVTRDVQVHGQFLRAGDLVYVMLGAANRDERRFVDAAEFRPERRPNQHLGFGYGIHFCVGAPLARLEANVALERLSVRLQNLHLTGSGVAWLPSVHQRTLARLDVKFSPLPAPADRAAPLQTQPHIPR